MSRTIGSVRAHHPLHQLCIGQEGNARQRLPVSPCRQVVLLLGTEDVLAGGEPDNPLAGVLLRQPEGDEGLPRAGGVNQGGVPALLHHMYSFPVRLLVMRVRLSGHLLPSLCRKKCTFWGTSEGWAYLPKKM